MNTKSVQMSEVGETIATARDLLAMVLGGADSINTLGIIMIEEILEGVKEEEQEAVVEEVLTSMHKNFVLHKGQRENRELLTKATKVAVYTREHFKDAEEEAIRLSNDISLFREQVHLNPTVDDVKKALKQYVADAKKLLEITDQHAAKVKWYDRKQEEAKKHNERMQEFTKNIQYLSEVSTKVLDSDKATDALETFLHALKNTEKGLRPLLADNEITAENCKIETIFNKQFELVKMFVEECRQILEEK